MYFASLTLDYMYVSCSRGRCSDRILCQFVTQHKQMSVVTSSTCDRLYCIRTFQVHIQKLLLANNETQYKLVYSPEKPPEGKHIRFVEERCLTILVIMQINQLEYKFKCVA